jgi:ABC-2 type transport system permease protein
MRQLLQYETRKLFKSKSFWFCGGALVLATLLKLALLELLYVVDMQMSASVPESSNITTNLFDLFTGQTFLITSLKDLVPIALSIFISLFVCFDFSQKTIRNVIAKGNSRVNVFLSKFIVCMLVAAIFSLASVLGATVLGSIFWGFGGTVTLQILLALVTQFLLVFSMTSWYLMLAILIRNPGITVAASILSFSVIGFALSICDAIFGVLKISTNIASFHLPTLLTAVSVVNPSNDQLIKAAACAVICLIVFNGISVLTFSKRDV